MGATERLRALVRDRMTVECSLCGGVERMPLRKAGTAAGVSWNVLRRFLNGEAIQSDTFDRLTAWVETPRQSGGS